MKDKVHIHRRQGATCETILARVLTVLLVLFAASAKAAIPEPDLVWYGKVLTSSGGATVRLTSGTLVWRKETKNVRQVSTDDLQNAGLPRP